MSDKATRQPINIGAIAVEGFMMPDGSYRMSQTSAAAAVGKDEINARRFLDSTGIKTLLGKGYTPDTLREYIARLEPKLRDNGLEPCELPQQPAQGGK
jgi:hypothetical protein